jgi:hypothetical protein
MPAWGKTHDDATIWTIVAFLQTLPTLSPEQQSEITQSAHQASGHTPTYGAHGADADHAGGEGVLACTPDLIITNRQVFTRDHGPGTRLPMRS